MPITENHRFEAPSILGVAAARASPACSSGDGASLRRRRDGGDYQSDADDWRFIKRAISRAASCPLLAA